MLIATLLATAGVPGNANADNRYAIQSNSEGERQALVVVHGIGNQQPGDYAAFAAAIRSQFSTIVHKASGTIPPHQSLTMSTALWAPITQQSQDAYLQEAKTHHGTRPSRTAMVSVVGDGISYFRDSQTRRRTRGVVKDAILDIASHYAGEKVSLHVVAHSLGTVIATDTLRQLVYGQVIPGAPSWMGAAGAQGLPDNMTLETLVTMGGPLASSRRRSDVSMPLYPNRWINLAYVSDAVGPPLLDSNGHPLNGMDEFAGVHEIRLKRAKHTNPAISVIRALTSRTPLSHTHYWADPQVHELVATEMAQRYIETLPHRLTQPGKPVNSRTGRKRIRKSSRGMPPGGQLPAAH